MNALTVNPHGSGTIASPIGLTQGSREKKPQKKGKKKGSTKYAHHTNNFDFFSSLVGQAAWEGSEELSGCDSHFVAEG